MQVASRSTNVDCSVLSMLCLRVYSLLCIDNKVMWMCPYMYDERMDVYMPYTVVVNKKKMYAQFPFL